MKKILVILMMCSSFLFAAINLQTASKEELMSIKGIGPKKAEQIIEYRKTNVIKNADDLKNIKGFGDGLIKNVEENKTVSTKTAQKKVTNNSKKDELKDKAKKEKNKVEKKATEKVEKTKKDKKLKEKTEKVKKSEKTKNEKKVKEKKEKAEKKSKKTTEELLKKK